MRCIRLEAPEWEIRSFISLLEEGLVNFIEL